MSYSDIFRFKHRHRRFMASPLFKSSSGGSAVPNVIDTFTRADSLTLGNAESGHPWVDVLGTWGVISGKAYTSTNTGSYNMTVVDSHASNVLVSADITLSSNNGIMGRYVDANNRITARMTTTNFNLTKTVGGVDTSIASYNGTFTAGTTYNIALLLNGTAVQATLDGTTVLSGTVSDSILLTATKCGLRSAGSAASRWDNFKVEVK